MEAIFIIIGIIAFFYLVSLISDYRERKRQQQLIDQLGPKLDDLLARVETIEPVTLAQELNSIKQHFYKTLAILKDESGAVINICPKCRDTLAVRDTQNKTIHEKHINQLFGTTVMYWIQKFGGKSVQLELFPSSIRSEQIMPCFITSTELSDSARQFAGALGVKIKENFPFVPYPSIKCNVSRKTGERIYHLLFDQQYDKTLIEEERNECYVETVAEAEDLGFRRAFRWRGGTNNATEVS